MQCVILTCHFPTAVSRIRITFVQLCWNEITINITTITKVYPCHYCRLRKRGLELWKNSLLVPGLPFGITQGQISQIWPFLIALGLDIFGLEFWHFFGLFGRVWPWRLLFGLNVIFWLYFGLFYTKVPFSYHRSDIMWLCAPTPIFRYHTLTVWLRVT